MPQKELSTDFRGFCNKLCNFLPFRCALTLRAASLSRHGGLQFFCNSTSHIAICAINDGSRDCGSGVAAFDIVFQRHSGCGVACGGLRLFNILCLVVYVRQYRGSKADRRYILAESGILLNAVTHTAYLGI